MPSINVSPGIRTKIIDLSDYVQNVPSTIGFIVVISEQGEDNKLIATNARDYYLDFGKPNINYVGKAYGQGTLIASSFLTQSDNLYVIRPLPDDADYANMILSVETSGNLGPDGTSDVNVSSEAAIGTQNELETLVTVGANPNNGFVIYGIGRGEFYNNFQIDISEHPDVTKENIYLMDIYQKQSTKDEDGNDQYEIINTYEVSFDYRDLDDSGESMFIEDVINRFERYIRCMANKEVLLQAITDGANFSQPFEAGPVSLSNGSSGSLFNGDGTINTTTADSIITSAYKGELTKTNGELLQEVLDTDNYYFNIVLDGGYPSDIKKFGIAALIASRLDCMAVMDNGDNYSVTQALTKRTDTHTFNSKYMGLWEPYSKIFDSWTGKDVWVSPVYHMASIIPYTVNNAELWYAPAGYNRATIDSIKELRFNPLLGDRENMTLAQLNYIVKFNVGYTVWEQKTTQKRASKLQSFNIMMLVLYIKRALEQFCKFYIWEQNDSYTWEKVSNEISIFLTQIKEKRGLMNFDVEVSATDYELKQEKFHVNVTLYPTPTTRQIDLNFYIK
jgi:hypothetical protein